MENYEMHVTADRIIRQIALQIFAWHLEYLTSFTEMHYTAELLTIQLSKNIPTGFQQVVTC